DSWTPLLHLDKGVPPADLASLYRQAKALLVTPLRDGLNLTAKEFIPCQGDDPGVLILSNRAGAWHELGNTCLAVDPTDHDQVAAAIRKALTMPRSERLLRTDVLKLRVHSNTLRGWLDRFTSPVREPALPAPYAAGN